MHTSHTLDPRAKRWGIVAKYAALLCVGFFVAPFIFTAITGLIGLIVAGVIMLAAWMLLPTVETAARNLRLKMLKAEAARNPIETLENEYLRREQELNERRNKITALAAKTENFGSQLEDFKRRWPANAPKYESVYQRMVALVADSRRQWKKAETNLNNFAAEIEKAKAEWAIAESASDLQKDAGKVEEEFLARIRSGAAFEAIQLGMNSAIAQIDQLLMESESDEINVTGTAPQSAPAALPGPESRPLTSDLKSKANP